MVRGGTNLENAWLGKVTFSFVQFHEVRYDIRSLKYEEKYFVLIFNRIINI